MPTNVTSIRAPRDEQELQTLGNILQTVFRIPPERTEQFLKLVGREHFRQVTAGGELAGGLALVPMGQYFGGRSVGTAGIVAVGIAAHFRQTGAGSQLMRAILFVYGMASDGTRFSARTSGDES